MAVPDNRMTKVLEHVFLSGSRAINEEKVRKMGISCIINCAVEVRHVVRVSHVELVKIDIDDTPNTPIHSFFDQVIEKINEVRDKGGRTLMHCFAGVSRSATFTLAYLVSEQRHTLRQAHDFLLAKRPCIKPNIGFWRQLIEFERRVHMRSSVSIINTPSGPIADIDRPTESRSFRNVANRAEAGSRDGRC